MSGGRRQSKTLAEIAELAGVSPATASRALRDSSLVTDETKARVLQVAREYNYRPHLGARHLRLQRTYTVAIVLPLDIPAHETLVDPFLLQFIGEVGAILHEAGYDLLISRARTDDVTVGDRYWRSGLADGLVVVGRTADDHHITALGEEGAPIVVWGPELSDQTYCSVGPDNRSEARQAVTHLIEQGRRRIGILRGGVEPRFRESYLRYQGYRDALIDADLPIDSDLAVSGISTFASGRQSMQQLLEQAPDVDAVFAYSDVMAIAAMEILRESGRRIPDDVAVVGFDDIDLAAYCNPPLTTVSQEIAGGGAAILVNKLIAQINGEKVISETRPGRLVIRESSTA